MVGEISNKGERGERGEEGEEMEIWRGEGYWGA